MFECPTTETKSDDHAFSLYQRLIPNDFALYVKMRFSYSFINMVVFISFASLTSFIGVLLINLLFNAHINVFFSFICLEFVFPSFFYLLLYSSYKSYLRKTLFSGLFALIDFFAILKADRNFFKACEYVANGNHFVFSDIFSQSIRESRISKDRLENLITIKICDQLFGEIRNYWEKAVLLWDKDPSIVASFIDSILLKTDEHFEVELKQIENYASIYLAFGAILPPALTVLLMLANLLSFINNLLFGLVLFLVAVFLSPYRRSKVIFSSALTLDSTIKASELCSMLINELSNGHNYRQSLINIILFLKKQHYKTFNLQPFLYSLTIGEVIDDSRFKELGYQLCSDFGASILHLTHQLYNLSPQSAIIFLTLVQSSIAKNESYYSKRRNLLSSEKKRMFTSLSFTLFSLGFLCCVVPIFLSISYFVSLPIDSLMVNDWSFQISTKSFFLDFFPIILGTAAFLFGFNQLEYRFNGKLLHNALEFLYPFILFSIAYLIGSQLLPF